MFDAIQFIRVQIVSILLERYTESIQIELMRFRYVLNNRTEAGNK